MKFAAVLLALAVSSVSAAPVAGDSVAAPHAHLKRVDKPHALPLRKRGGSKKCRPRPTGSATSNGTSASGPAAQGLAVDPTANSNSNSNATPASGSGTASTDTATGSAPATTPPAADNNTTGGNTGTTAGAPNGKKAGLSSGMGIDKFSAHIGWWYDWTPAPAPAINGVTGVPMLWGSGNLGGDQNDAARMSEFKSIAPSSSVPYVMGFEEPDCDTPGSANMDVNTAASIWNEVIAPWSHAGSKLISPSMCKQMAETFLEPFKGAINTQWDYTNVHINKNNMEGVKGDLDHYAKYGKPLWISEFACVDDSTGFVPCTDDGEIAAYINGIVDILEKDDRVVAYAFSNGLGLGDKWRLTDDSGNLTPAGTTYLNAIQKYH